MSIPPGLSRCSLRDSKRLQALEQNPPARGVVNSAFEKDGSVTQKPISLSVPDLLNMTYGKFEIRVNSFMRQLVVSEAVGKDDCFRDSRNVVVSGSLGEILSTRLACVVTAGESYFLRSASNIFASEITCDQSCRVVARGPSLRRCVPSQREGISVPLFYSAEKC